MGDGDVHDQIRCMADFLEASWRPLPDYGRSRASKMPFLPINHLHAEIYMFPTGREPEEQDLYPWVRSQGDHDPTIEDPLCAQCRQINFKYLLQENVEKYLFLGNIRDFFDSRERASCKFCQLCAERLQDRLSSSSGRANLSDDVYLNSHRLNLEICETSEELGLQLPMALELHSAVRTEGSLVTYSDGSLIEQQGKSYQLPNLSVRISTGAVSVGDGDVIRSWLEDCERFQPLKKVASFRSYHGISFIDVDQGCLVEGKDGLQYAALSYIWGVSGNPFRLLSANLATFLD